MWSERFAFLRCCSHSVTVLSFLLQRFSSIQTIKTGLSFFPLKVNDHDQGLDFQFLDAVDDDDDKYDDDDDKYDDDDDKYGDGDDKYGDDILEYK